MSRSRQNADIPNKIDGVPIGATTPASGAFTSLAASGAVALNGSVSGAALTNYLASPPAIGGTAPGAIAASTLSASGDAALNGNLLTKAPAPASYSAIATFTAADLLGGIIVYTGAGVTLTLPLATALDTALPNMAAGQGFDFSIIHTGSSSGSLAVNTGITSVGSLTLNNNTSSRWRIRKTGTATYVVYRLS